MAKETESGNACMAEQIITFFCVAPLTTSVSLLSSDVARINALIHLLSFVMTIGKYCHDKWKVFALVNLTVAFRSFLVWNSIASGVINSVLSLGGFVFLGQLIRRRNVHRYDYRYGGRQSRRAFVEGNERHSSGAAA